MISLKTPAAFLTVLLLLRILTLAHVNCISLYVFTAFTSESESNLFVYLNADAQNFVLLKGPACV